MKSKFTLLLTLSFLAFILHVSAQVITNGLVAYYPFDGNAKDSSGNINDGTVYGAVPTTDRFGNENGAYLFDGFSAYIEIPSSSTLESPAITNQVSMSAWVYLNGESLVNVPFDPVIEKTNSTEDAFMYRMGVDTGFSALYSSYNSDFVNYLGLYRFTAKTWYFLTTTFNGSEVKSYVNGSLISTVPTSTIIAADSHFLTIGKDAQGVSEFFNGAMDDIGIYNRALSDSEVQLLYVGTVLPVTLTKFTATYQADKKVSLAWSTANEINTTAFTVERSADGTGFQKLATLPANAGVTSYYSFDDNDLTGITGNMVYYRLQQTDKDGSFSYSSVVPVKLQTLATVVLYPNPASSLLTLRLKSEQADRIRISIVSTEGKRVVQREYTVNAGTTAIPLDIASLAKGIYILQVTGNNVKQNLSFIKQ